MWFKVTETVIHVEELGKRYRVGERYFALRNVLARAFTAPFRRGQRCRTRDYLWALRDMSFDVRQGEVVGLIGRNGAGKTTLLKILSCITRPTEGYAEVPGRVGGYRVSSRAHWARKHLPERCDPRDDEGRNQPEI